MNLLIAGDTVPNENNVDLFENADIEKILGKELKKIWNEADYKIFNLEAPITKSDKKINKYGPNLKIEPRSIKGIKKMNPTLVLLANNHIMDYGEEGLKDTINILTENNINYIGVGNTKQDIKKSFILHAKNKKIAIYNCCETEFSIATSKSPGANDCNLLSLSNDIQKLKKDNDYLIVIYHGGKEHYRYPSPYLQKLCRNIIEYGADLVLCQHSHCIGCYEKYKDKMIVYGQGNFIFDKADNEFWNTSLIISINIFEDLDIKFIPIKKVKSGVTLADDIEKIQILKLFEKRSQDIKQKDFIENEYEEFAKKSIYNYLQLCLGNKFIFKVLYKLGLRKLIKKYYSKETLLGILNAIECEAHRELFIEGLKEEIYKERD